MKLIDIDFGRNQLCLSTDEFWILCASIVEINEAYHKPRLPIVGFYEKFGYSLSMHEQFTDKLFSIEAKDKQQEMYLLVTQQELDMFNKCLREILSDYEEYEFQIITGYKYEQSKKVFDDLQILLGCLKNGI
jgi:hypothetical protein